jgi:hypothetical protein
MRGCGFVVAAPAAFRCMVNHIINNEYDLSRLPHYLMPLKAT